MPAGGLSPLGAMTPLGARTSVGRVMMEFESRISKGQCNKDVTPLLMHWSYIFLALSHRYIGDLNLMIKTSQPFLRTFVLNYSYIRKVDVVYSRPFYEKCIEGVNRAPHRVQLRSSHIISLRLSDANKGQCNIQSSAAITRFLGSKKSIAL